MASHRSKSGRALVAAGVGLVLLATYLYLFRTVRREIPGYLLTYHFRWGSLQKVGMDLNKDGLVDFEGSYVGWATDRAVGDRLTDEVASSNCDGVFDVKIERSEEDHTESVIFDADGDGIAEVYEAAEGFRRMATRCEEWMRWVPEASDLGSL